MKKINIIFALLLLSISSFAQLPSYFEIEEEASLFAHSFSTTVGATIDQKVLSWTTEVEVRGKYQGKAKVSFLSWTTQIKFYDGNNKYIGKIEKVPFSSGLFRTTNVFEVYNASNKLIAISKKDEWYEAKIILYDPNTWEKIVIYDQEHGWNYDTWECHLKNSNVLPAVIALTIPVFKTIKDNSED